MGALALAWLLATLGAADPSGGTAKIVYLSGRTAYIDAGRDQGLQVGQEVTVQADSVEVVLSIASVSSKRASCVVPAGIVGLRVGNVVVFIPMLEPAPLEAAAAPTGAARSEGWLRQAGIRGSVDLRYLALRDQSGGGRFSQPALNLRLSGREVGGSPVSFSADVRTRRTYRTRSDGEKADDSRNRVYRLNVGYAIDPRVLLSAGRQTSPDLASVSIFDGLVADYRSGRWKAGAFVGTQPDPEDFGYSTEILEFGAFGRLSNAALSKSRWSGTAGAVSSRVEGEVNRDYLFFRAQWNDSRWNAYGHQEIDINRGWKTDAGESAISPTSTVLSLQVSPYRDLLLRGGFDNRRNIRVARDRETPETDFDDTYRLGWSLDGDWKNPRGIQLGLGFKTYGGAGERSESVTGRLRFPRLTSRRLDLAARSTWYRSPDIDGLLHSLSLSGSVASRHRLEGHAGVRDEDRKTQPDGKIQTWWYGIDADVNVTTGWFLMLSFELTRGDLERNDQIYTSVSYRF